jgi:c-di-GMP-binding flagellar brake protein YcgR
MKRERRSETRRRTGASTIFVMDRRSEKIATLIDISAGGMQMRYAPENRIRHPWSRIDVFTSEREQPLVRNLACRTVYDVESLMANESFKGSAVRNCGVCFEELTSEQRTSLNELIESLGSAHLPSGNDWQ